MMIPTNEEIRTAFDESRGDERLRILLDILLELRADLLQRLTAKAAVPRTVAARSRSRRRNFD